MGQFAKGTTTPVERTREELARVLKGAGVVEVGFFSGAGGRARCAFKLKGMMCAIEVPAVDRQKAMPGYHRSRYRSLDEFVAAEERRRWRALLLVVKAKLEAVASGISVIEDEFLANIVLANGRLLADELRPKIKEMIEAGAVPSLLPN